MVPPIPGDVLLFLRDYRGQGTDPSSSDNLEFYQNKRRSRPDQLLISEFHSQWRGAYGELEYHHGFIQWLFPIREHGMNFESQPLMVHELEAMKADPVIKNRLRISYDLMLDFYGMSLIDETTGLLSRSSSPKQPARYRNLLMSSHNNLRITRILKCLTLLGLENYVMPFLLFILTEQTPPKVGKAKGVNLDGRGLKASQERWWNNCVKWEEERNWLHRLTKEVWTGEKEWDWKDYEKIVKRKAKAKAGEKYWEMSEDEDEDEDEENATEEDTTVEARTATLSDWT